MVHKDLFFWKNHATYSHIGFIQIKYGNTETQRSWPFNMHSWIGSFNQKIADPIRSDPGVSDMDLDPIQIHKNRIFDPDRGSFRSDHYTTGQYVVGGELEVTCRKKTLYSGWIVSLLSWLLT